MNGALLRRLVRARDHLHAQNASLVELAEVAGLSRAHFAREFARLFGVPPHQYQRRLQLDRAKRALAAGTPVTEVCYELGFASLGTFSTTFQRRVGASPRAWQKQVRPFVQSLGVPMLFIPACFMPHV